MNSFTKKYATHARIIASTIALIVCLFCLPVYAQVPVGISPAPRLQFLDSNGHPLAGGCVFTYQAGTSTPQATYIDSGGVFQNTNPIILDGGGFASIWLAAQAYDIAVWSTGGVNCATGVQQYKTLNINSNTALLNNANVWSALQTFNGGISGTGSLGTLTAGAGILATQNTWTANQNFLTVTSSSANPSLSGFIRMSNGNNVVWRNSANTTDMAVGPSSAAGNIPVDTLGELNVPGLAFPFFASIASSNIPASSGSFRLSAGDSLCWRNQANSGDVCITKNATDTIVAPGLSGYKTECVNTTPVTVGNTVTPTNLQTCTIPANEIVANSAFYLDMQGIIGDTAAPSITINIVLDGVVVGTWLPTLATANNQAFSARAYFVGVSTGVSGQITGAPLIWQSSVSGGGVTGGNIASNTTGVGAPPQFVTINTTVSHVLSLQITWGAANALNTITSNAFVVYRLN